VILVSAPPSQFFDALRVSQREHATFRLDNLLSCPVAREGASDTRANINQNSV
jgi:hypothetical protein